MTRQTGILVAGWMTLTGGCASVTHTTYVDPKTTPADVGGFVYYESSPYLLVTPNGKGGINWQIVHWGDPTKRRVAKPRADFAKLNSTLVFSNGVLTQADTTVDEAAVGKALVSIAKTALMVAAANQPSDPSKLRPLVFKIIVKGNTMELWGVDADTPIVVSLDL